MNAPIIVDHPARFAPLRWATRAIAWGRKPLGPGSPLTRTERLLLLAAFALLVVLRLPQAWLQGRFVDEEGTIFFAYAWHRPAIDALLRSFGGYLNIGANATTLLAVQLVRAGLLPLAQAPYLTMALALAVQMLPALLLVTGPARWLTGRWTVAASLLILATAPMTEEVFVNVLHIQFHLALCAALILALEVPRGAAARAGYAAILFLAPLCGPGAVIVLPLFALRALVDHDPARLAQLAVFAAGTAIQLLVFFHPSPVRGELLSPATLAAILSVRLVALPLFTSFAANAIGRGIHFSQAAGGIGWWYVAAAIGSAYLASLLWLALRRRQDAALWLVLPALAIGAVSFSGGMIVSDSREWFSVGAGERYNFLPLVLLSWGVVALAGRSGERWHRPLLALVALTLLSGAITYALPLRELSQGPSWAREVAVWRGDHDRLLATWPGNWWVDLSDRDRPCPPPRLDIAAAHPVSGDPSYCESAWLARVANAVAVRKRTRD